MEGVHRGRRPQFVTGERIEVYSNSLGKWLEGVVDLAVVEAGIYDGYTVPAGALKVSSSAGEKWILPDKVESTVRKLPGYHASPSSPAGHAAGGYTGGAAAGAAGGHGGGYAAGGYAAGAHAGGYGGGHAGYAAGAPAAGGYAGGGYAGGGVCRPVSPGTAGPSRPPMTPGAGEDKCRYCDRRVQPGLTKGMNKYDTCCKKCSTTKGTGGHDENCGGTAFDRSEARKSTLRGPSINVKGLLKELTSDSGPLRRETEMCFNATAGVGEDQMNRETFVRGLKMLYQRCGLDPNEGASKLTVNLLQPLFKEHHPKDYFSRDDFHRLAGIHLREMYLHWFPPRLSVRVEDFVQRNTRRLEHVYNVGKKLGEGSFGAVFTCTHKLSDENRVCKKIQIAKSDCPLEDILKEIQNMAMLDHPNVLKVYEYFVDETFVSQILEPCRGGELQDKIDDVFKRGSPKYDEAFMRDVMKQTLRALAFMHEKPIMHKDLKPQNIMLSDKSGSSIKVIDFGLAELFKGDTATFVGGTLLYMPPEAFSARMQLKSDIWSAGVVLYNLVTGSFPFCGQWPPAPGHDESYWQEETINIIQTQHMKRHAELDTVSRELRDLLDQMLQKDVSRRPTASQCLDHRWFEVDTTSIPTLSVGVLQCMDSYTSLPEFKKAVFLLMAHQSALPALQELRAIFTHFDRQNKGTLNLEDLKGVLLNCGVTPLATHMILHALDRDEDGAVSWTEFTASAIFISVLKNKGLVAAAFATFDTDSDEHISVEDVAKVLGDKGSPAIRARWRDYLTVAFKDVIGPAKPGGFLGRAMSGLSTTPPTSVTRQQFMEYIGQPIHVRTGAAFFAATS